jgi:hypothetical protein
VLLVPRICASTYIYICYGLRKGFCFMKNFGGEICLGVCCKMEIPDMLWLRKGFCFMKSWRRDLSQCSL